MAMVEETVEKIGMDITLQPSQEERSLAVGPQKSGSPMMCPIELLREQNIKENHAKMVELGLLEEKKPKQVGVKRKKQPAPAPSRRSSRVKEMPKVNYDDEDWEVEHFGKRRRVIAKSSQEGKVEEVPLRKSPRELSSINYGLLDKNMDEEIYCYGCELWVVPPCAAHGDCGMQFVDPAQLSLEVVGSKIHAAGEGLINRGATIVKGTLLGPYTGKFVSSDDYKQEEKKGQESGYAWLLYDSETLDKPCGYIDPGSAPDPALHMLAKANHPSKKADLCLVGCQYQGNIYYRATKDIFRHQEVFVDYGPEYAAELGIDQSTYDTYSRPEYHKTVATPCSSCGITFSSQHFLDIHQPRCGHRKKPSTQADVKQMQLKQGPVGGGFPCPDSTCGKIFSKKGHMTTHHRAVHLKERPFKCGTCGMTFVENSILTKHTAAVHLKLKPFKCTTCGLTFARNDPLTRHVNAVHLGKRPFLCKDCGATFALPEALKIHIKSQHTNEAPVYTCSYTGCSATYASNENLKFHLMDHTGERPFPCPYESCSQRFKAQHLVNHHIKTAKKHAGHRLASKFIDKHLLPFTCQVEGCVNRYETEVERDRHMEKLHPKD